MQNQTKVCRSLADSDSGWLVNQLKLCKIRQPTSEDSIHMVSVIVPVYNAQQYIRRCLDSIIGQSYRNIEIVLVDDGSSDQSPMILQKYKELDGRIRLYSQKNRGVAAARNTGLAHAKGDFFLFVDADDWIATDAVETLVSLMDTKTDLVLCESDHAREPGEICEVPDNSNGRDAEAAKQRSHAVLGKAELWDHDRQLYEFMKHQRLTGMLWNKLIRRSITEGIQFNEKTGYGEDAEFLWKVLKRSRQMVVTDEVLYHHVMEDGSISHLSFSDRKYSAIPMWESINREVEQECPDLLPLARERLMCATVFSLYEARQCRYQNEEQIAHMRAIARKYLMTFLRSPNVSGKFKLYAAAVCVGY